MILNSVWLAFFLSAIAVALVQTFQGDFSVFPRLMTAMFDAAKTGFDISLGLVGIMALWLGFMKIGERASMVDAFARGVNPLLRQLFPGVPAGHPAQGAMTMNNSANMLGLDNAATPIGLRAMRELQTLNPSTDTASNAQILFLVLNASSLTLLPVSIFMYRAQQGAPDPTLGPVNTKYEVLRRPGRS